MVVPFTADQPFWGKRTHDLGAGPRPIPFSRLTADTLAQAMREMIQDGEMQRRAVQLREAMAEEHGVQRAVERIKAVLAN